MPAVDPGELDRLAADATAPRLVERLGGWRLQADDELPFRRSKCVVPLAARTDSSDGDAALDVATRIAAVEAFYCARRSAPRFQVGPAAEPDDLDDRLAARGYEVDAPVDVLVAELDHVMDAVADTTHPGAVGVDERLVAAWCDAFAGDDRTRDRLRGYGRLLASRAPASRVATLDVDGEPVAVGFGVVAEGWLGVFGMATRPAFRRQGAARLVLGALARWGRDQAADRVYLQVELGNDAARRLYESVGLRRNHRYHYRVLAADVPTRDAASR